MRAEFEKKALDHQAQADVLTRARDQAYRRGKGFQLFVRRRILRPIGKIGGAVFNGIDKVGRVTFILVRDEVVFRAKEIVRIKLQELKNLAQGKIDLAWNRLAGKIGGLPTEILRRFVIDPAFVAWRDQNLKRVAAGSGNAAGQTENEEEDDDYNPDAEGLNEEGETGYDDEDQPQTLTGNQIYDVKNWFPEENSYDVCMALGGDFAEYPVHDRDIWRYLSTGYGDKYYMDITCDFRRVPDLHRGFEISIEAYQKDEEIIYSSDVDYLSHYCVEDPAAFTWGEHTCRGTDYMLEERMCNEVSCNTRLTFLDQNVATFIMIEHAPGTSAVAEIEAMAEHLRQIYAEKRSITTTR
jgi:hypothetical protein